MITKIYGAPGTGKTTKLLSILEEEIASGVPPIKIAFMSHTRAAREEAIERILKADPKRKMKEFQWFKTVHAMCFKMAQFEARMVMQNADYDAARESGIDFGFTGGADSFSVMSDFYTPGSELLQRMHLSAARMIPVSQFTVPNQTLTLEAYNAAVATYKKWKYENNKIDYLDMLEAYLADPRPLDVEVFIIDEAQDLSKQQWKILRLLRQKAKRIYIAGDDDQNIYDFIGADPYGFLEHECDEEIVLPRSYRCPGKVWALGQALITQNTKRQPKNVTPRASDGTEELERRGMRLLPYDLHRLRQKGDVLVLHYNRKDVRRTMYELQLAGIPHLGSAKGTSIWDGKDYDMCRTWWKFTQDREMTVGELKSVIQHVRGDLPKELKLFRNSKRVLDWQEVLHYGDFNRIPSWRAVYQHNWPASAKVVDAMKRAHDIYGDLIFTRKPGIRVMTIHASKGREADTVVIDLKLSPGAWRDFEENPERARRICYVAVTRSRRDLIIIDDLRIRNIKELSKCLSNF